MLRRTHKETSHHGSNGGGRNVFPLDRFNTSRIGWPKDTIVVRDTGATRIGQNTRIDGQNVRHGHEGTHGAAQFRAYRRLAFFHFKVTTDDGVLDRLVDGFQHGRHDVGVRGGCSDVKRTWKELGKNLRP